MAAHFAPPLPCIPLAPEQSETHANGDPECQPATSLLASNNTEHPRTLWHRLTSELLWALKHLKQESRQRPLRNRGRLRGESQGSEAWFDIQRQVERSQSSTVRWSSSNNNREQRGAWTVYRQKTRTDVSINRGSCGASLLSLRLL